MAEVVIIGCGYTGRRVAERLLREGAAVTALTRTPAKLAALAALGARVAAFEASDGDAPERLGRLVPPGSTALYSIPTLRTADGLDEPAPRLLGAAGFRPRRLVYLSTTGVYGEARVVDEATPPAPRTERQRLRVAAEQATTGGPWQALILRPAAIYGPGRGVHVAMAEGRYPLVGDGSNFVSRVHVEDLAALATAALKSELTGAFPVADEHPCSSREIAEFCAALLGLPPPESKPSAAVSETRRSDRRVDGSAIRGLLAVGLQYPSYRAGVPAALDSR